MKQEVLTEENRNLFLPYLEDGEEILWTGKPYATKKYRLPKSIWVMLAVALSFWAIWIAVAFSMSGPSFLRWIFLALSLPYLIGLGVSFRPFFRMKKTYLNTSYALTDRKAVIVLETPDGVSGRSYPYEAMDPPHMDGVKDGTGSVYFGSDGASVTYHRRSGRSRMTPVLVGFVQIDSVEEVYRIICDRRNG